MSKHSIHEVNEIYEKVRNRQHTLPAGHRETTCGLNFFKRQIEHYEKLRNVIDNPAATPVKEAQQRVDGCVRLAKHCMDQVKKNPTAAFEQFNIGALIMEHELERGHPVEAAVQTALRKQHTFVHAANNDKQHWLRNTPTYKLIA